MRWLPVSILLLVFSFPATAAQKHSGHQQAHKPRKHSSHPSHPMRNTHPKHHAMETTESSLLAVRYVEPQQASSAVAPKSTSSSGAKASSSSKSTASSKSSSKTAAHTSTATSKTKKSTKKSKHARREPTQKAPTPERISEIQSSLARGGYYQGDPNGKWDPNTIAAMQKFQSANGLDPSGRLDATSLQKLGLGSGIAGVSAPKPPCCSTAPASGSAPQTAPSSPTEPPKPAPAPSANSQSGSPSNATSGSTSSVANASAASDAHAQPPQR